MLDTAAGAEHLLGARHWGKDEKIDLIPGLKRLAVPGGGGKHAKQAGHRGSG